MCVFVPQNVDARGEMHALMATPEHIIVGGVGIVQDAALCIWILSHENPFLGKTLFFDCLMHVPQFDLSKVGTYDGRHLIEQLLPAELEIEGIIEHQKVISGINKKVTKKKILRFIYKQSKQKAVEFINSLQRISAEYFARRGFSVGLSCLEPDKLHLIKQHKHDMQIQGDDWEVIRRGMQYKETNAHAAKSILRENNRFLTLTSERSCAKGSLLNIIQMLSSLGQQFFKGGLINTYRPSERGNRVLSSDPFNKKQMNSHGYIESAFLKGLNPQELFLHAISSRLSLLDTALKTATSGYASRRLWKSMEDCIVQYDMSLRCNGRMLIFKVDPNALTNTIEPGYAAGLEAAEKIGQMIMQLTLNTFHLAGTNNATVTQGVPRLEALINVWTKKQGQQRLIYEENIDPWKAHCIILEEDTLYIKDLEPQCTTIHFKRSNGRSPKSLRFTFQEKKCIRNRVTMWHIEDAIFRSKLSKYCLATSKGTQLSIVIQTPNNEQVPMELLQELKDIILNLCIRGKGQNIFYNNGTLERKGVSMLKAFEQPDWKHLHSTSIIETAKTLGISAAKDQLIIELNKVFNNGVDLFDIQCLAEWMCNKGKLTSTTRSGIASFYEEENVLKCMAFERTLRTAAKAATMETKASFKGLSEKILVNDLIDTGSGFCDVIHDNEAFIQYNDEMETKRKEQEERKRKIEEDDSDDEPWLPAPEHFLQEHRPKSPTYNPFRPPSPAYDPFRPPSPAYDPNRPPSPAYDPNRPPSPEYHPFTPQNNIN